MKDVQYIIYNNWALASDGLQWILQRRRNDGRYTNLSFVRSTKEILERCMREKGMPACHIDYFTARLPSTFDEWITNATGL